MNERAIAMFILLAGAAGFLWWHRRGSARAVPDFNSSAGGLSFNAQAADAASNLPAGVSFDLGSLFTLPSGESFASYAENVADMNAPRGIRNRNPGNIRRSSTLWQGQSAQQTDTDFVQFDEAQWGLRAIAHIFRTKQGRGLRTPRQMISGQGGWAPVGSNDNNPAAYADAVAQALGVGIDDAVDLSDLQAMQALVTEIVQFENGQQPYGAEYIAQAVTL